MGFDVRLVIFFGTLISYGHFIGAVTKFTCVSYNGGLGRGINSGYGGAGIGGDLGIDGINSADMSDSSEELGVGLGGYGTIQHGIAPRIPSQNLSPGTSPLAAVPGAGAGGSSAQTTGAATASGLPNTAASLGGATHLNGQNTGTANTLGQMPFSKLAPGHPGIFLSGSLSCLDRPGTTILITKLVYGNGGIYTCSAPDQDCDVVDYRDQEITPFCDGQIKCMVRTTGKLLPGCKVSSNFVHIEYECINPWSSFNICNDVKTVVREPEVYIMSPSFFQAESPPSKTCECILKSRYDNRIMAQYVHTDIQAGPNNTCPESFVLFESKLSPNETNLEKRTEVCGRRSLNNYMYRGDLRITFKDADSGRRSGFVSKLLVPPVGIGLPSEIAMECGAVRMPGDPTPSPNNINQNFRGMPHPFGPFSPLGAANSQFQQSPRIPAPPVFEGMQSTQGNNHWGMPPPVMNTGPMNWGRPNNWGAPNFPHPRFLAGSPGMQSPTTAGPPPAWARNQNPPSQKRRNNAHQVHFMGRNRRTTAAPKTSNPYGISINKNHNRGRHTKRSRLQSKDVAIETQNNPADETDKTVSYIIVGIGAIVTAFCALFISVYCTRRRRKILERKASRDSEMGSTSSCTEDTPISVLSAKNHGDQSNRDNNGHVNEGFQDEARCRKKIGVRLESFENISLDDDDYHTLEDVEERRKDQMEEENIRSSKPRIDAGHREDQEVEGDTNHRKTTPYDNNVQRSEIISLQ